MDDWVFFSLCVKRRDRGAPAPASRPARRSGVSGSEGYTGANYFKKDTKDVCRSVVKRNINGAGTYLHTDPSAVMWTDSR